MDLLCYTVTEHKSERHLTTGVDLNIDVNSDLLTYFNSNV